MAERRMFAKTIVLSDAFLDMPLSARCLYFTLGMLADDDGFVNSPKSVMRQCGASEDDINILLTKKFLLLFESGVIVIKHWRINNYLRSDRHIPTKYNEELSQLTVTENGSYSENTGEVLPVKAVDDDMPVELLLKDEDVKETVELVEQEFNRHLKQNEVLKLYDLIQKYGAKDIYKGLRQAIKYRVHKISYIEGVLNNWEKEHA